MTLGVLATIWLALALHPCAMAYGQVEPALNNMDHPCPHCPPPSAPMDCELVDWQQTDFANNSVFPGGDQLNGGFAVPVAIVALSLWQPLALGDPPPPDSQEGSFHSLPLTRQDQLRL